MHICISVCDAWNQTQFSDVITSLYHLSYFSDTGHRHPEQKVEIFKVKFIMLIEETRSSHNSTPYSELYQSRTKHQGRPLNEPSHNTHSHTRRVKLNF